jgi:hypothetical protein
MTSQYPSDILGKVTRSMWQFGFYAPEGNLSQVTNPMDNCGEGGVAGNNVDCHQPPVG